MQANLETDRAKQQDLIKQADDLRAKAMALQKGAAASAGKAGAKPGK
jgi:hypothetical protein